MTRQANERLFKKSPGNMLVFVCALYLMVRRQADAIRILLDVLHWAATALVATATFSPNGK